jgi:hypothetical protein
VTTIRVLGTIALILSIGCSQPNARIQTRLNHDAELSGVLPYNPLNWEILSSTLNPAERTLSTLTGNAQAVAYARQHVSSNYPVGSILAMTTWRQQEDPRWFGGKIPESVRSVEFLEVQPAVDRGETYLYKIVESDLLLMSKTALVQIARPIGYSGVSSLVHRSIGVGSSGRAP